MRLLFAGTPATAVPSLDRLIASTHDVVGVLTRPDAPAGRGRVLTPSPVKQRAIEAGIEVCAPKRLRDEAFMAQLRNLAPDACAVVAYGALIPPEALDIPPQGWINLHFSLLPAWRGAAPVQHAILHGDEITGATTFRIEADLDTGPVFGMLTTEIGRRETAGELLQRLSRAGAELLVSTMDAIAAGAAKPEPQPAEGVSYAPKLTPADTRIDWTAPARHVDRLVRAATPDPGAWTTFRDRRLGLGRVQPLTDPDIELVPGQLDATKNRVLVGTGGGLLELGDVQPAGKAAMPAADWARGVRLQPSDVLS